MSAEKLKVVVSPPGRLGTALGFVLAQNAQVTFCFRSSEADQIFQETGENRKYFPGKKLPESIHSSDDPEQAFRGADVVILTPKARYLRTHYKGIMRFIPQTSAIVHGCKGLEIGTNMRMSQVLRDVNPRLRRNNCAVISGPNFAREMIRGLPASTVIASEDDVLVMKLQRLFRTQYLQPFRSDDVIGVELGGALKNPIAMVVGICEGLQMGDNAAAALMNRGLKEVTRLAVVLGADERTLMGLSGVGDLVLSCRTGGRNYDAGVDIGHGEDPKVIQQSGQTIEALNTIGPAVSLAVDNNVQIPILEGLYGIIYQGLNPTEVMYKLLKSDSDYEDPRPIITNRLKPPLRALNRFLHLWGNVT